MATKSSSESGQPEKGTSSASFRAVDDFFERASKKARSGFGRRSPEVIAHRIGEHATFVERELKTADRFAAFVAARPDAARAMERIRAVVRAHPTEIRQLEGRAAENADWNGLSGQSTTEQYRALVIAGYVDPSTAFDDIAPMPTLCEFGSVVRAAKQGLLALAPQQVQQLGQQWQSALQLFAHRWERVTGRPLAPGEVPTIGELTQRKAPVPFSPTWSDRLYAREARAMGAEPLAGAGAGAAAGAGSEAGMGAGAGGDGESALAGDGSAAVEAALDRRCNADELLVRAGSPPLRPPAEGEPRYTFPGRLLQREDIFYDYALVVPVDECGEYGAEITGIDRRSLSAVRVLAAEAVVLLDFLRDLALDDALGRFPGAPANRPQTVAEEIRDALAQLLGGVDDRTSLHEVHDWRRRFAEYAALVRSAARRQLFAARVGGPDPRDFLGPLTAALANVPVYRTYQEDRIRGGEIAEGVELATYLELAGLRIGNVRPVHGNMSIDENDQVRNLKHYLEYLGGEFHRILTDLVQAAADMRDAVQNFQGSGQQLAADFERIAQGRINEAAFVLARLLDDIGEQLPLWSQQWTDGSKRLAMLILFRQYWTPEGYVKGKLVGHKNLTPGEKSKVRRRTFIQTTTETSTVQEFARMRQEELSQTRKETAELLRENATKFNLSLSASGSFDFAFGSIDVTQTTDLELSEISRTTQSAIAEISMKSSAQYNEKREVKIREERQLQDEFETETLVENPNTEITANYFYYQLLRQYLVTVELHDIRPVLLRTRYAPSEAAIDDKFLSDHAHVLIHALPAQLADDLQDNVHEIDALARRQIRSSVDYSDRRIAYDALRAASPPATPEEARDRETRLATMLEGLEKAKKELFEHDEAYLKARARLDRVLGHVRRNRTHYMQYVWQSDPRTDDDRILRTETFHGTPLPELTRGLQRQGYYGAEEIFDFTGPSIALSEVLLRVLRPGSELAALPRAELEQTTLFQQLRRYYSDDEIHDLLEQIGNHAFLEDPAGANAVLSSRRVQIAQDAIVVETLPGQVPLLEGFKLAHRMLDVERVCLENQHLAARIADRPWQQGGEDVYRVYRRDGQPAPVDEEGNAP